MFQCDLVMLGAIVDQPAEVNVAVLEVDGTISVVPKDAQSIELDTRSAGAGRPDSMRWRSPRRARSRWQRSHEVEPDQSPARFNEAPPAAQNRRPRIRTGARQSRSRRWAGVSGPSIQGGPSRGNGHR
jgi:hypothetical protein